MSSTAGEHLEVMAKNKLTPKKKVMKPLVLHNSSCVLCGCNVEAGSGSFVDFGVQVLRPDVSRMCGKLM